jgi:hypothetical protein
MVFRKLSKTIEIDEETIGSSFVSNSYSQWPVVRDYHRFQDCEPVASLASLRLFAFAVVIITVYGF